MAEKILNEDESLRFIDFLRPKAVAAAVRSDFFKNVATLLSGNILAQIITFTSAPITTRLYSPQNFGSLALFAAIVGTISKISCLCYERAILLPKEEIAAFQIFIIAGSIHTTVTLLTATVSLVFCEQIALFFNEPGMAIWIRLVPVGVFLMGAITIFRRWRLRKGHFRAISLSRAFESIFAAILKISAGFFIGAWSGGLILGSLLGTTAGLAICYFRPEQIMFLKFRPFVTSASLRRMAVRYKKFPIFASLNAFFNTFSEQMAVFALAFFFSPMVVGFYSLGIRMLRQPIVLIADSVQNVFFQKVARKASANQRIKPALKATVIALLAIGVVPFGLLALFGESIFRVVFGNKWSVAGVYTQILSPWLFFFFVGSPAKIIYEVCQKQDVRLLFNVSMAVCRIGVLIIASLWLQNVIMVLFIFSLVNTLFELAISFYAYTLAGKHDEFMLSGGSP